MKFLVHFLISVAVMLAFQQAAFAEVKFNKTHYTIKNLARGEGLCLDVYNGGKKNNHTNLSQCGNYSGQLWKIQEKNGWFSLTTMFRGPNECLGDFGGKLKLNQCAESPNQLWAVEQLEEGVFAFTNQKLGNGRCLDTTRTQGQVFEPTMKKCSGSKNQLWVISLPR